MYEAKQIHKEGYFKLLSEIDKLEKQYSRIDYPDGKKNNYY